jgi:CRP/FNR family transcriptional regulator, cyclic AMP receptor protein
MPRKRPSKSVAPPVTRVVVPAVAKTTTQYAKSQKIYSQGDLADTVGLIQSGTVKITVINKQGKEAIIAMLEAGDFLGENSISNGSPLRLATATAMEPATVLVIQKKEMLRALQDDKPFADQFIAYMLRRNRRIEADLVDQLFNSTEKRLARSLLLLAQYGKDGKPETVISTISQETLAEMVGTTRSRINFFMTKFRKLGFIHYNGGMQIHSSLLNVVLHDD